ncbi:MAG TPA: biotin/lipoyl-containing protein, partial [Terriglobales bacterium]|nr:biotin/lipoyl-containing protein [Terriglobales bacterium]
MIYEIAIDGKNHRLELNQVEGRWECTLDGEKIDVNAVIARPNVMSLIVDGEAFEVKREMTAVDLHLWVKSARFAVDVRDPRSLRSRRAHGGGVEGPQKLLAPMPGKIVRILAPAGTAVTAGQGVLVIEAMKMQNELKSPKDGTVKQVVVAEGTSVSAGEVLAIVE